MSESLAEEMFPPEKPTQPLPTVYIRGTLEVGLPITLKGEKDSQLFHAFVLRVKEPGAAGGSHDPYTPGVYP